MPLDIRIFYFLNSFAGKSYFLDVLVILFADYLQYFLGLFFILFLFFSAYTGKEKIRILLVTIGSIVLARLVATEIIRFFYHRLRPFLAGDAYQLILKDSYSFPSGHAAFFFAMAAVIYGYNKKLGIGFFTASIIMGFCRVVAGIHYPSDIMGGMAIGIIAACLVPYFAEKRKA